ncbi:hypothetical protein V1504DRAFT_399072 [Lipomyces starkeyi]
MEFKIFISILALLVGALGVINYDPSMIELPSDDIVALYYNDTAWMDQYVTNLTTLSWHLRSHGIAHDLISYKTIMPNASSANSQNNYTRGTKRLSKRLSIVGSVDTYSGPNKRGYRWAREGLTTGTRDCYSFTDEASDKGFRSQKWNIYNNACRFWWYNGLHCNAQKETFGPGSVWTSGQRSTTEKQYSAFWLCFNVACCATNPH